jgi:TonB family protein
MKFVVIAAFFLCGCASTQPSSLPDVFPELMVQTPLPAWPAPVLNNEVTLQLKLRIARDGSVLYASFVHPTGYEEWDTAALAEIRKWRFSPALVDGQPVAIWIRQQVRVQFENPNFMMLAELVCPENGLADSLYTLLSSKVPFDSLARKYSISSSRDKGGVLGEMDLRSLPFSVRRELATLRANEFTRPMVIGGRFVIYKRLPPNL